MRKSIPRFSVLISTKCGIAPTCLMAFEVATKLNGEVITSSSFFTFKALRLMPKAAVPEFTAIIYFDLTIFLIYSQIYLQKNFY